MDEKPEEEQQSMPKDLIHNILKNVADLTRQTQRNTNFKNDIVKQLKNIGFEFFPENENEIDHEHVIRILKVAINNTIACSLDLERKDTNDGDDEDDESYKVHESNGKQLERLLEINDSKCLDDYFSKGKVLYEAIFVSKTTFLKLDGHGNN